MFTFTFSSELRQLLKATKNLVLNDRNVAAWPFSKFDGLLGGPLQGSDAEPSPMVPA